MTSLFRVTSEGLKAVNRHSLKSEELLEGWIAADPRIVGLDVMVIGRQVITEHSNRIDILAMDREGDLTIIELKRDRTPREVVAQVLDYASWVRGLTTRNVHDIAVEKLGRRLSDAYRDHFDAPLPENLNNSHSMVIVASELDPSSRRIVEYLAEEHDVSINTAFFNVFEHNGEQLLATDWLEWEGAGNLRARPGRWYFPVSQGKYREFLLERGYCADLATQTRQKPWEFHENFLRGGSGNFLAGKGNSYA